MSSYAMTAASGPGIEHPFYQYQTFHAQGYPSSFSPFHSQPIPSSHQTYSDNQSYLRHTHQDFVLDTDSVDQHFTAKPDYHPYSPAPTHSSAHSFDLQPPVLSSTSDSGASFQSNLSSAMGSPTTSMPHHGDWTLMQDGVPSIVRQEHFSGENFSPRFDYDLVMASKHPDFVDPSLIQPSSPSYVPTSYSSHSNLQTPSSMYFSREPPSPAASSLSSHTNGRLHPGPLRSQRATSPYQWNPYSAQAIPARRPSISSIESHPSQHSQTSFDSSEEGKGVCPIPSCGRHIKDLKAHLLTHKNERPEKCPISSCEYHIKGFARKYDKNRHTLTHYKGTMVCGFCPGSGSASEKSFNRADVFKRHLTSVHGVEQTAPNSRRKTSPGGVINGAFDGARETSGTCSTCGIVFANAQDFYEHLDDCVLRVVQQGDPSEAINERILTSMADDEAVKQTMERHMLSPAPDFSGPVKFDQDEDDDEDDRAVVKHEGFSTHDGALSMHNPAEDRSGRQGMTHSKGGMSLQPCSKGNKRRKNYPQSWGSAPDKMRMKKRVMCVFDGPRRLWKDDMMLDANNEVRVTFPGGDGRRWVTDLDLQTLRRAEGFHGATEEEKGPWVNEEGHPIDFSHQY